MSLSSQLITMIYWQPNPGQLKENTQNEKQTGTAKEKEHAVNSLIVVLVSSAILALGNVCDNYLLFIIYYLLVKLIKSFCFGFFFSSIILYIAGYQLWWIKIFKQTKYKCPQEHWESADLPQGSWLPSIVVIVIIITIYGVGGKSLQLSLSRNIKNYFKSSWIHPSPQKFIRIFFDNFLSYQENTINFPYPTMVQNSFKKFYIRIQNPMTSKINGNFLVQRYISSKIFIKIRSVVFYVKLLTDKQTHTYAG